MSDQQIEPDEDEGTELTDDDLDEVSGGLNIQYDVNEGM